jgi:cyclopropane fatty-acyl-phospholipid synthase-like methyltransferase
MTTLDRSTHNKRIANYYDQTYAGSSRMWFNSQSLALHFGYWDETTRTDFEAQLNTNQQLANRAGLKRGQKVLDAGCGVGGSSVWLAETYATEVLGITISADQVRHATENAARRGVSHLTKFSQQDYTKVDAEDASFDVVWALESVSCALVKREFFAEAFRLLKPGGMLILSDGFRRKRPFATKEDEDLMRRFLDGWALPDLATPDELLTPAKEAGFENVQCEDWSERAEPSMLRLYKIGRRLAPIARVLAALKLIDPVLAQSARGSRDQYIAYRRGLCGYLFLSARKPGA